MRDTHVVCTIAFAAEVCLDVLESPDLMTVLWHRKTFINLTRTPCIHGVGQHSLIVLLGLRLEPIQSLLDKQMQSRNTVI